MSFTPYQQAVLQEIGVPLWIPKSVYEEKDTLVSAGKREVALNSSSTKVSSVTSQQEKQSHLASLRAQVSNSLEKSKKQSTSGLPIQTVSAAAQKNERVPSSANNVSTHHPISQSPQGVPLSAEQKAKSQQWLSDLQLACVQLGIPSNWASTIMVGRALSVDETAIILPATPLKLSATQKRELWAQLVRVGQTLSNGQ
ncbi:hypothetical protein D210916BOD24_21930 [Alteromonas sp. D210916BOD_24]|uniref:alanine acetyltransferase n=1 Tax=Alteromonas sp. D210916BOD_24 TaxID=3157618 RepID=UPI00399C4E63